MPTETRYHLPMNLKSILSSALAAFPSLRPEDQPKLPWAKLIESYMTVPDVYKDFFEPFQADPRRFPYTVLTPSYEDHQHPTTGKLITILGPEIFILEDIGDAFMQLCYPISEISYVEQGTKLLYSWLKIYGMTGHDGLKTTTLNFNSVTDYLFEPILKCIRPNPISTNDTNLSPEIEKFAHLAQVNYKFMNYARRSLLGGEKVIHTFLQPEIRKVKLAFLGKSFYRIISATHITILTDQELIVIQEEANCSDQTRYGGIWDYIPLNKIASLTYSEKDKGLLELSVNLTEGTQLDFIFQAYARPEVDRLIDQYKQLVTIQF
jgi:hypothetical protein